MGPNGVVPVQRTPIDFEGATAWLNSSAVTAADLRGHVVLIDFWTFTCINWIRTAPYLRAWESKYRDRGVVVIGVHTPEFPFETDVESIRAAIRERGLTYPVAVDSDYSIWSAFANRYWPALYIVDRSGAIRFWQFGEGEYAECERAVQNLLGASRPALEDVVTVMATGVEAAPDWASMASPETYVGWERAERFSSPGGAAFEQPRGYTMPSSLGLNRWALAGDWTIGAKAARSEDAGAALTYRFRARDLHLVMGPADPGTSIAFRVRLDGAPPFEAAGVDVDSAGRGVAAERRLYQLIRQPDLVRERTFEIMFFTPGAEVYVFTFG